MATDAIGVRALLISPLGASTVIASCTIAANGGGSHKSIPLCDGLKATLVDNGPIAVGPLYASGWVPVFPFNVT